MVESLENRWGLNRTAKWFVVGSGKHEEKDKEKSLLNLSYPHMTGVINQNRHSQNGICRMLRNLSEIKLETALA